MVLKIAFLTPISLSLSMSSISLALKVKRHFTDFKMCSLMSKLMSSTKVKKIAYQELAAYIMKERMKMPCLKCG